MFAMTTQAIALAKLLLVVRMSVGESIRRIAILIEAHDVVEIIQKLRTS